MSQEHIDWNKVTVEGAERPKSDEKKDGIEGEIQEAEKTLAASVNQLSENVNRLPEPASVSPEEHPGLREKLEKYKRDALTYRDDFMTKIGLGTMALVAPAYGALGTMGLMPNMPASPESGLATAATAATVGLFVTALDQAVARVSAYLETKKYEKRLLEGDTY